MELTASMHMLSKVKGSSGVPTADLGRRRQHLLKEGSAYESLKRACSAVCLTRSQACMHAPSDNLAGGPQAGQCLQVCATHAITRTRAVCCCCCCPGASTEVLLVGAAGLLAAAAKASRSAWTSRSHSMWRSTIFTSLSAVRELTNAAST